MKTHLTATALVLAVALLAGCKSEAPPPEGVAGRVQAPAGASAAGLMVTLKAANGIETTVFTGADGSFNAGKLADGTYGLQVHGAGLIAPAATVKVAGGTAVVPPVTVAADPDFLKTLPSSDFMALLPEGPMKREFILNCTSCHEIAHARVFKDGKLRDESLWLAAIKMMRAMDVYKLIPPDMTDEEYAKWLATNLSAERIATLKPPAPIAPALAGRVRITEYPLPDAKELPHDLLVGPDGKIWVTAFWFNQILALDPATGQYRHYDVNEKPEVMGQVRALTFDREGKLWTVLGGTQSLVKLDTATGKYQTFPVGMYAHDISLDSKGTPWVNDYFAGQERVGHLDPATGRMTIVMLPSANLPASAGPPLPYGMQVDAKDRLWSTQLAGNTLARYEIATGKAKAYPMPEDNVGPRRTALAPDGSIWMGEFNTGRLTRFDPETEQFTRFDTGQSGVGIYDTEYNPKTGDLWAGGSLSSSLWRLDMKTKRFDEIPLPTAPAYMRHLAVDPKTGDVWTAYSSLPTAVPKVVRVELSPASGP